MCCRIHGDVIANDRRGSLYAIRSNGQTLLRSVECTEKVNDNVWRRQAFIVDAANWRVAVDYISVNGQLAPYDDVGVAPGDAGLLHGAGLFETMRARNGHVFRMDLHLDRLLRSAQMMQIELALTGPTLAEMVTDLLAANELDGPDGARVRLTVTRGDLHAATNDHPVPPVTLILSAHPFGAYPKELYERGMTVAVCPYKQNPENPLTGHKTTSYFDRLLGLRAAHELKCGEALWFTAGGNFLAEGCISNVFVVDKDGTLSTPPVTLPAHAEQRLCLPGITRNVVMELAGANGIAVQERLLTIHDLLAAREVFLTNAVMGVMPVSGVEKHTVGEGKPGKITLQLHEAYRVTVDQETS